MHRQQESTKGVVGKLLKKMHDGQGRESPRALQFDQVPVPCCRIDLNTLIRDCNELFGNLFACPKSKLVGTPILDVVDRSSYGAIEKIMSNPISNTSSSLSNTSPEIVWFKRKDPNNVVFPASLSFEPFKDNSANAAGYIFTIIDETSSYKRIDVLEKDRDALRKKEQLQDEFIAVASHELRTPIQPILGFALLARKGLMSQDEAWDGVLEEARKLQHLANDILDVSRIEAGTLKYEMRYEKINHLLTAIIESLKNQIQKKDVTISFSYDQVESDLQIELDRARITQLVSNIVGNAIKFTEKGNIKVETKAFPEQNKTEIRISDTGKGIAEDVLPKLFEKFVTKGHGNIANNKGTGLGLYISKAIVNAHAGEISALNNKDGGATFIIMLPISQKEKHEVLK